MSRTHEEAARQAIDGLVDDVLGYINPANDGMLSAWMMALEHSKEIQTALQTVCDAIAARPGPGQMALRAIADEPPFSEEPFADDIRRTVEARQMGAWLDSNYIPGDDLPAALDALEAEAEAQKIDAAHPGVFNMSNFAADVCGMKKVV